PPAGGSALPQRVPGASSWPDAWTPDRRALLAGTTGTAPGTAAEIPADAPPETRPVPTRWSAAGRRGPAAPAPRADERDDEDDLPDEDDLDEELDELRGGPTERTEVIWRAPGADDVAPAPEPAAEPEPFAPAAAAPYTGARPRRFAAEPTDPPAAPETVEDPDGPGAGRVRVVLSERRSTAQSSRGLSDVQDPGAVGTLLRNSLVRTQLLLALRVSVVALVGLGVLPALFIAVPVIGQVEVLGIRLPWLLLGVLVYPFLLGLGWWYVSSAEAAEQDFADDVADR
ncbi:hypothetical protein, partial [Pseudonocardia spirodelae]